MFPGLLRHLASLSLEKPKGVPRVVSKCNMALHPGAEQCHPLRMRTVGEDEGMTGTAENLGFAPADEGSCSWSSFKLGVQNLQQEGRMRGLGGPVVMAEGRPFFATEAKGD